MKKNQKAFSIIELLLVLAVFGAMLLVVMPFGKEFIGRNRAKAYTEDLRTTLRFTRAAAIGLGEPVKFCGSKDRKTCDGMWQEGQIVKTSTGKVMRVLPKIPVGDNLICKSSFGEEKTITFLPTGFSNGQQGHFYYCPKNTPENAVAVILESTGRVKVSNKTADGETISCNF